VVLDRAVNGAPDDPLQALLSAVRVRLWARQSQNHLHRFYWQVAALVLVSAGIHHWLTPVPHLPLLLGSAVLLAIASLRCWRDRPTLEASAAFADREFGGHALLATAVECARQPGTACNDISTIILRQAGDAARAWRPRVASRFRSPPATASVLAIVPLFAGLVLLSLPGKDSGRNISLAIDNGASGSETGSLGQAHAGVDEIALLRSPPGQAGAQADRVSSAANDPDAPLQLTPREATGGSPAADPFTAPAGATAGVAAATGDDDAAGDARPALDLPAGEFPGRNRFDRRELLELQRTGAIVAAGEKRDASFADAAAPGAGAPLDVLAAAAPETRARQASLTAAQAAYARRYLAETGDTND